MAPKKNENENSNMVSKSDFENLFQCSIKEMITKREKQKKDKASTYMDEDSLDMNVFDMFTGKHNESVSKNDDDSMSITNNLFHFEQTNEPDKCYLKNSNNYYYYAIACQFKKIIKLKHEPEAAPEKKPVQYIADIIAEIKNRDGKVVPMRALLNTETTATIILREFVGKGRALKNIEKRTKWKQLEVLSLQIMNLFWISNFQRLAQAKL
jgi:hypothetical protein